MFPFNYKHYVGSLRTKAGEYRALRELIAGDRDNLTPLWEVQPVPEADDGKDPKTIDDHLETVVEQIVNAWPNATAFIDVELVEGERMASGAHPLEWMCTHAKLQQTVLVPVTGPDRDGASAAAAQSVHANRATGIAIRLPASAIADAPGLRTFVQQFGNVELDLVVDLEYVTDATLAVIGQFLPAVLNALAAIRQWHTFTLLAGSFPELLSEYGRGMIIESRPEWSAWRSLVALQPPALTRKPTYGDYGIAHPIYTELPPYAMAAAAIRYTAENEWYIFRGYQIATTRRVQGYGFAQYNTLADQCRKTIPPYRGRAYSAGDRYIDDCGNGGSPGNNTTWRFVGTNQHIVFASRSALAVP
jgi:hypothetical protein